MQELINLAIKKASDLTQSGGNLEMVDLLSELITVHLPKAKAGSVADVGTLAKFYDTYLSPTPHLSTDINCPRCSSTIINCFDAIKNYFEA